MSHGDVWAVVLAGGDGSRLESQTVDARGRTVPKQYWSPGGNASLLSLALRRARSVAAAERVCAVVAAEHWHWWETLESQFAPGNLLVQSADRGTGNAVLLATLTILRRDPDARIVFVPSDQVVADEALVVRAAREALDALGPGSPNIVLVGIAPERADPDVGYIVPPGPGSTETADIDALVEPGDARAAEKLVRRGALWNSMIVAGRGAAIAALFLPHHPGLVARMQVLVSRCDDPCSPPLALQDLYERLPSIDFLQEMLHPVAHQLILQRVPACGWCRLTTPRSVRGVRIGVGRTVEAVARRDPHHRAGAATRAVSGGRGRRASGGESASRARA